MTIYLFSYDSSLLLCSADALLALVMHRNISVNSNWVHLPGNTWGLAQKNYPGASGFDKKQLLGGREFHKGRDSAFKVIRFDLLAPVKTAAPLLLVE